MNLINYPRVNCFFNSIITLANEFNAEYMLSFHNLWSEDDFDFINKYYVSKRLASNLCKLGVSISSANETKSFSDCVPGEYYIIGADSFHIPWNPSYRLFNSLHFFIVYITADNEVLCFDPTFNKNEVPWRRDVLVDVASEIRHVKVCERAEFRIDSFDELRAIAQSKVSENLISACINCITDKPSGSAQTARYIDCLINCRYLYRYFLEKYNPSILKSLPFANEEYFENWYAIKNGMNKAALSKSNEKIINEVCDKIRETCDTEHSAAKKILQA